MTHWDTFQCQFGQPIPKETRKKDIPEKHRFCTKLKALFGGYETLRLQNELCLQTSGLEPFWGKCSQKLKENKRKTAAAGNWKQKSAALETNSREV